MQKTGGENLFMKLNYKRTILVGFAFFLISAFWQAYDAIVPMILENHFGLPDAASGFVMSFDNILAVFMLPLFGGLSDRISTRRGKRTPFILIGTIAAIVMFISLSFVDGAQVRRVNDTPIPEAYEAAVDVRDKGYELLSEAKKAGDEELIKAAEENIELGENMIKDLRSVTWEITEDNMLPFISFVLILLFTLMSMATFRSPAVALMPDVTVKPLRSKGNAIINLMGTGGAILILVLGIVFGTSKNTYGQYSGYVIAVCSVMALGLIIFLTFVKENKWAAEMAEDTKRLGIEDAPKAKETEVKRKLSKGEFTSLILILASVALWYIGYNSITSKYSIYATRILGFDYNITLIVAQAAAIISYIPVGIISSKIGRKKSILAGIVMLASAFFVGNFINPNTPEAIMYPIFALAGIGWATINVNSFPMVVELASGADVGKYTGYYYTASMSAQIVAPILSGFLYGIDALNGMRGVFFAFGTIFVVLSFVTMLFVKHGDSKPAPAIPEVDLD